MKIIILNASNRKNGATASILIEMYQNLIKQKDIDVQLYHVADLNLQYCIGCSKCYKIGKCIFKDDIENLSLEIEKADGIIFGSPTYASNVSGQMKTIIDRGHFVIEQLLYNKYAISVTTYENYGGKNTKKVLNNLFLYSGAKISKSILLKIPFTHSTLLTKKTKHKINKTIIKFRKDIVSKRPYYFQSIKHFIIFNVGIYPFVKRKGKEYEGVLMHWNVNVHNKK